MRLSARARGFESHRLRQNKAAPKALFCFGGDRESGFEPEGPEREAKQSGGLFRSDGSKRAAEGSRRTADRNVIRVNPTVSATGSPEMKAFQGFPFFRNWVQWVQFLLP